MKPDHSHGTRPWRTRSVGLAAALMMALAPATARAVDDTRAALPNVLLLVDTSGSMENMVDGRTVEAVAACQPGTPTEANRWGRVVQTLTGTLVQNGTPGYSCQSISRENNPSFQSEFQVTVSGQTFAPYDSSYFLPYHRPVSGNCVYAPGVMPGVTSGGVGPLPGRGTGGPAWAWPANAIVQRRLTDPIGAYDPTLYCFDQMQDGIIDGLQSLIRFGLMTFDNDTDPGTGTTFAPLTTVAVDPVSPFRGGWSYFLNWNASAADARAGKPFECVGAAPFFENGSRSPAAPPWEGRMIPFDSLDSNVDSLGSNHLLANNLHVQQAILAARPSGATPIAGMLHDAQTYLYDDPNGPQQRDTFVQGGCREQAIILLTDGAPNMDLRPGCMNGVSEADCPYKTAKDTAADLYAGIGRFRTGNAKVKTYVVGFAVTDYVNGQGVAQSCSQIVDPVVECAPTHPNYNNVRACCYLQEVAVAGGTTRAYFAETADQLQAQFRAVLNNIKKPLTSRTVPSFAAVQSGGSTGRDGSSKFTTSFEPSLGTSGEHWAGRLERERTECTAVAPYAALEQPLDETKGDKFQRNMTLQSGAPRRFFAVRAAGTGTNVGTAAQLGLVRAPLTGTSNDGLSPTATAQTFGLTASTVLSGVSATDMGVTGTDCANRSDSLWLTAEDCADRALMFALAQSSFRPPSWNSTFPEFVDRSQKPLGDLFRGHIAAISAAAALITDPAYAAFGCDGSLCSSGGVIPKYRAIAQQLMATPNSAPQPSVVYAASNDGLLHSFFANIDQAKNNEIWSMLVPHVLPGLKGSYNARVPLLDGGAYAQDVIFDRARSEASDALIGKTRWRTALVGGFGEGGGGYYALDVTDPRAPSALPSTDGPKFLWQLSSDAVVSGRRLFGRKSANAAIATIQYQPATQSEPHEVGVAILPGGWDGPAPGAPNEADCPRRSSPSGTPLQPSATNALISGATARGRVRRWSTSCSDPVPGATLSVVRLDTGEVLRHFTYTGGTAATPQGLLSARITDTPLDSPMTGTPTTYPSGIGAIADRAFVGDADGTMWRLDMSSPDPANWRLEIFVDLYSDGALTEAQRQFNALQPAPQWTFPAPSAWYRAGHSIVLEPAVSLNEQGRVVLNVASGNPENYLAKEATFVYSIEERLELAGGATKPRGYVNWYQPLLAEHVTGPMPVFDSVHYFATFVAPEGTAACTTGNARIYGRHFTRPLRTSVGDTTTVWNGGAQVAAATAFFPYKDRGFHPSLPNELSYGIIPGVAIAKKPACTADDPVSDPSTGQVRYRPVVQSGADYVLVFNAPGLAATGGTPGGELPVGEIRISRPPRPPTVSAWASFVDGD